MHSPKEAFIGEDIFACEPRMETLRSGKKIALLPLRLSVRAKSSSMTPADKIVFILSCGIAQPEMNESELLSFLDSNMMEAVEVYNKIQRLSAEFDRNIPGLAPHDSDGDFMAALENIAKLRGRNG